MTTGAALLTEELPVTEEPPVSVLDRVALLLSAFEDGASLTLSEIVERTGIPRSSIHRMLNHLVMLQWLRRTDRTYQLGFRFVELGSLALQQDTLHRAAQPLMHELHRITGMVVHLGVLDGHDVVYVEKIGGVLGGSVPTRIGGRLPACKTAVGRAMLAFADSTSDDHRPELARVRESGIATEAGEALRGFSCIAAPIGLPGRPIAAISICGPSPRMHLDHRGAAPVRMAAGAIWQTMNQRHRTTDTRRRLTALQVLPSAVAFAE